MWTISRAFSLAQQPNSGPGRPTFEVYKSHTIRHTHLVGLVRTSDQLVAESAIHRTNTTNIHTHSGIRTHDPSNQGAVDLQLRQRGHWDRQGKLLYRNLFKETEEKQETWQSCSLDDAEVEDSILLGEDAALMCNRYSMCGRNIIPFIFLALEVPEEPIQTKETARKTGQCENSNHVGHACVSNVVLRGQRDSFLFTRRFSSEI